MRQKQRERYREKYGEVDEWINKEIEKYHFNDT
jgi:hypothetical protein